MERPGQLRMKGIGCYTFEVLRADLREAPRADAERPLVLDERGFDTWEQVSTNTPEEGMSISRRRLILLLTLPVSILAALLIPLTSKARFLHPDTARRRLPSFRIIKFRTMLQRGGQRPAVARNKDGRVTGIGKILRKARIDEIPSSSTS